MYNYMDINYTSSLNGDIIYMMGGLGRVKFWQGSVGAGYAYNWVPMRGLLVNVMAMPMLTFVNKLKAYAYTTNVEELMEDPYSGIRMSPTRIGISGSTTNCVSTPWANRRSTVASASASTHGRR